MYQPPIGVLFQLQGSPGLPIIVLPCHYHGHPLSYLQHSLLQQVLIRHQLNFPSYHYHGHHASRLQYRLLLPVSSPRQINFLPFQCRGHPISRLQHRLLHPLRPHQINHHKQTPHGRQGLHTHHLNPKACLSRQSHCVLRSLKQL